MQKPTTRSHYLPQTYLKHFLLEDKLFMYKKGEQFFKEKLNPEERILTIKSEGGLRIIGAQNDLYNPKVDGVSSDDLEEIFREYGENTFNDLVHSIEFLPINSTIPQEIKDKICLFMASMRVRTPQFKWEINEASGSLLQHDMSRIVENMTPEEIIENYKKTSGEEITIEGANKVKEMAKNKSYRVEYPNGHFIKAALLSLGMHADIFHQMRMILCRSENRYFITSDNPVVFFVPPEKVNFYNSYRSLTSPFTEVFFPITKNIGVTFNRRQTDEKILSATHEMVDIFNYNISHNSFNFIFSSLVTQSLKKFTEEFIPYPFKITTT